MANYFNLTLDTTAPQGVTISLNSGAVYTTDQIVTASIATSDGDTTGYQMLIWGTVDNAYNANIQTTEGASSWISYSATQQVKVATTDGTKTVYVKIRDDVDNPSAQASDTITLNTAVPAVSISGVSVVKISKVNGKNETTFSFSSDVTFAEYKVKVVSGTSSTEETGTTILTTNGSSNMSATGTFASATPINCAIRGADLEVASAGDGTKIVKVFVKNEAGIWSN
jgi:hypothetical protein